MDRELNDLLFEIEDSFTRINSRIKFIKDMDKVFIEDIFELFEYLKLDCNDFNFYTRALRDKINESEIL